MMSKFSEQSIFKLALIFLFGFSLALSVQAQQQTLTFNDGGNAAVVNNFSGSVASVKLTAKEISANYESIGKAVALSSEVLAKLKKKNKKFYKQAKQITTAIDLTQGENHFYVAVLESVNLNELRDTKSRVRCKLMLVEIRSADTAAYIPVITAVEKEAAAN